MLPTVSEIMTQDIEFVEQPSHTFQFDADNNVIFGFTDNQEAMKQAVYLILNTERYKWAIFSWNYGIEFEDLLGMPTSWVVPEAERRIKEALMQDTRITSVDGFEFNIEKRKLFVSFTAHTIFGSMPIEQGVSI